MRGSQFPCLLFFAPKTVDKAIGVRRPPAAFPLRCVAFGGAMLGASSPVVPVLFTPPFYRSRDWRRLLRASVPALPRPVVVIAPLYATPPLPVCWCSWVLLESLGWLPLVRCGLFWMRYLGWIECWRLSFELEWLGVEVWNKSFSYIGTCTSYQSAYIRFGRTNPYTHSLLDA